MKNGLKAWFAKLPDLSAVMARFPVATVLMVIFTVAIILDSNSLDEKIMRLLIGLAISAYLSFCITIAGEIKDQSKLVWLQVLLTIPICVLAWYSERLHINLAMALGAVLLFLGNVILWRKSRNDLYVWDFTHKIWTGAVFATVGSVIFTLGIFAITIALKSLFGLDIEDLLTDFILPIGLGFLAPLYWLSTVPQTNESYEELYDNPGFVSKAVAFFGTWLLSSLTLIYALILLAYAVKIALTGALPKGEIAGLTTPFLIIGTLTWLILEPPFIRDKFLAKLFRKSWFFLSIPAAFLLAVSVFVRVQEYGLTPERFALILAVIWALGIGFWFVFAPQTKRDIRFIPGFASVLFLIGTFGADSLSIQSQAHRLKTNLEPAGLLTEAGELSGGPVTDLPSAQKVKGSTQYLLRRSGDKALERILRSHGYKGTNIPKDIYQNLGVNDVVLPSRYNQSYIHKTYKPVSKKYDLDDYKAAIGPLKHYFWHDMKSQEIFSGDALSLEAHEFNIFVFEDDTEIGKFDIEKWVESLKVTAEGNKNYVFKQKPIEFFSSSNGTGYLKVHSINQSQHEARTTSFNIEFSLLIKDNAP